VKPLVSCAEAGKLDAATAKAASIPPLVLMEDASLLLWQRLEAIARSRAAGSSGLLLALAGGGNNGGDALALLRHARFSGLKRLAAILVKEGGELSSLYEASLKSLGIPVLRWNEDRSSCEGLLAEASLLVDGISGTGLSRELRENASLLVAAANAAAEKFHVAIAAIDLPSGLSDSYEEEWPLIKADWTLSVEPRKACLYFPGSRESCGEILPVEGVFPTDADIGVEARLLEAEDLPGLAAQPRSSAHKGSRGRVAVFAGSRGASGAPVLASRSCLAAGAGLVSLYASSELYPIVAPMLEAVMVKPEPQDFSRFDEKSCDAFLVGPGWGRGELRKTELAALLGLGIPAVLDADAIYLFRELCESGFRATAPLILTPHPGEFAALTGESVAKVLASPPSFLRRAAEYFGATIALKSHITWIVSVKGELAVWEGRESGLGTAGSGDVLAGTTAALLARSLARGKAAGASACNAEDAAFSAARAAVIAHGLAGRRARASRGWFEAGSLTEEIAKILGAPQGIFLDPRAPII
jgi:ADP-dependent NAD(P)H-hydrate dehydratase / NAD(P)H-hydrate epimerase